MLMEKNIITLAEEYCRHFHKQQKRKGGNQEPYESHPFAVRDILVKYGYDDPETQAIALLHDTVEDTSLEKNKGEIEKRFGAVVYEGVYALSNNTIGKHNKRLSPLFASLGIEFTIHNRKLTSQAYKLRILFSRNSIKRVKIADMIHNTKVLPDLSLTGIERKLQDAETFYIPLGMCVAPLMVQELAANIINYKASEHYKKFFGVEDH